MTLRLAALEPPSKSYANRIVQSFFVQLFRNRGNEEKREAGGQGEFSVGLASAGMSHHNQQLCVEEGRSLLGGTHAIKSVKLSVYILELLSTGVNMNVSAPYLIHRWLNESRQSPSFMLGGLG